jgi:hypothetical protein
MRRRRRTVEAPTAAAVTGACNITRAQAPVANANAAAATSIAATFGSNVTAGNLLVAFVAASTNAGTAITFSSTGSPTWVTTSSAFEAGAQLVYAIGYCKNAPSGATTITATFAGSYTLRSIFIVEYSGADTTAPLDQFTAGKSTAPVTNPTDDAMVTTQNGDLIVALGTYRAATSPASVGAGYTLIGDDSAVAKLFTEEQIQSAAGSIAATFNVTGGSLASGIMSASFKCSGVAATTPSPPDSDSPRPRRPWMRQRRRAAIPPVTVTVGDTPVVPADQRTNVRITWQEHPRTRVASPPLTITITPVVPADSRTNLRVPWSMRGRARHTEVPPAPQVVITSTPVVEQHQAARKRPWFARARRTEVPPPQVVVTVVAPPDVRRPRQVHIQPPRGYQAVPPVTTVVGDTPVIPADGRNNLRIPPYRPRGRRAEPPLTITVTPVVEQRRGASRRPWLPRRSRVATPPLTVTVTQVVEQHRTSARPPWMFRARPRKAEPVQTPTVTVTTTPVIEQHRTSLRIPWLQRHRRFTATPTPSGQAVNTTTPVVEQHRTALRIPWPMRGKPRQAQPVQTPPVVVTVYVPQSSRPRLRFPGRPRAHATQVVITPTPTLPPSAERVQRPGAWLGRRRRAVPPAPITVTVGSTPIAEQPRRLRRPSFFTRRRPTAESQPVPPQVITFTPVVPQSKRPRHWFWRLIHTKGRRSEVVPPQGTIIPLATDRCVKVHGREGSNAVGQEGTNVSHGQESSNVVGREAPRTVFGKRSGNVSGEEDGTKC